MKNILIAFLIISSFTSLAKAVVVNCGVTIHQTQHNVVLAMDSKGKIVPFNKNQYVLSDKHKNSPFAYLSMNLNEAPFESIKTFTAPNGYFIVTFFSTADAVSVGVYRDLTKGFYKYQDLGSGNGNQQFPLVCKPVKN